MTWAISDYPFLLGAAAQVTQGGSVVVPADGSGGTQVSYGFAYASTVTSITMTPVNVTPLNEGLSWQVVNSLLTGFEAFCTGGAPGSIVTLYWSATGQ